MSYGALGLVEVLGSCNAVVVLDQMLKTSDVEFRTWHTKCGGHATVFLSGDVATLWRIKRVWCKPYPAKKSK